MTLKQTHALVLHVTDYAESDKLVTIYCQERGRLKCIAKGAKRSKKRFVNKLELFSLLDIMYAESRHGGLLRIDQAELLAPFRTLRNDFARYAAAQLICELMLHWTRENDGDRQLFDLLRWSFETLDRGAEIGKTIVLFQIKMLGNLGYRPRLSSCIACSTSETAATELRFSPMRGGLVCGACQQSPLPRADALSLNTVRLLAKAQEFEIGKIERLQFSAASTREALHMLKEYNRHLLQRDIRSWDQVTIV